MAAVFSNVVFILHACYIRAVFIRHTDSDPQSYVGIPIMVTLQFDLACFGQSSEYQSLCPSFIHVAV